MKRWALVRYDLNSQISLVTEQETKPVVYVKENVTEWIDITEIHAGPGWIYDSKEKTFTPPPKIPATLTRLELIELLADNYADIVNAGKTDPLVEVWLEKLRLQQTFDLGDQKVRDFINFLVNKKLLLQSNADKILDL